MTPSLDYSEALVTLRRHTVLVHLRLLATSDLHAHLLPFDYYLGRADPGTGLVALAGMIETARGAAQNCLLVDNGDTLQGSPLADVAAADLKAFGGRHPMIEAMNALGYDAMTLGNHDFDYGVEFLDAALDGTAFPVVLANASRKRSGLPYRARGAILERDVTDEDGGRHRLRIGITGSVPPQVARWNRTALNGRLRFTEAVDAVRREVAALRDRGADLVIVLTHSGLGRRQPPAHADVLGEENVARSIADLPGVDLVVAGHTHEVHPSDGRRDAHGHRAPIVQPGALGSHLGCIDLALVREVAVPEDGAWPDGRGDDRHEFEAGPWRMKRTLARALPMADAAPLGSRPLRRILKRHPELRQRLGAHHRATRAFTERELGATALPLTTYFSTLAPCAATQLIADTQKAAARALIEGQDDLAGLPLLSAVAPMRCGGRGGPQFYTDVTPGPLLLRHIVDLYGYHNPLAILRMKGRDVIEWLERAAAIYHRIDPACEETQYLIDHSFAGYNFDRIDGLDYEIDVSVPARTSAEGDALFETGGRVKNVRHADGRALDPDEDVLVATNTYRAAGGGHFPMCEQAATVAIDRTPVRELIVERIRAMNAALAPKPRPHFSLTGYGAAKLLYGTGPGALEHAPTWRGLGLTPEGLGPTGFQYFALAG